MSRAERVPTDAELRPLWQVWPVQCSVLPFRPGDHRDQQSSPRRPLDRCRVPERGAAGRAFERGWPALPACLQYNRTFCC